MRSYQFRMFLEVHRPVLHGRAGRVDTQVAVIFPVLRRPDWSGHEPATAIGAGILQDRLHAGCAEGALIGTDARFGRIRRQWLVAMLTGWAKFEHGLSCERSP